MYTKLIKPTLDFLVALKLSLILLPVGILVALGLSVYLKGSPFFLQKRPGKNERIFTIIKFKTMTDARNSAGELLADEERLTGIGKLVRSLSLDEIPQLLNVLKGDMSIVGPRPLLISYLPLYNDTQKRRHVVRPGITGYAQVHGRNAISWEKKFEKDVHYVDKISFNLDIKILLKTVKKVFLREDINSPEVATTKAFKGTKER